MIKRFYSPDDEGGNGGAGFSAIDAHVHFWKYNKKRDAWITSDMQVLQQNYLPEQLMLTLKRNEVDGVVAVQADQSELETLFLVELSKTHNIIKGVVGWVDLSSPHIEERLDFFSPHTIIKGWRHIVQAEPPGFLARPDFRRGVSALLAGNYTYDVLIYQNQLNDAIDFVSAFPDQPMVLDHCAKPAIRDAQIDEWKAGIQTIAQQPHLYCKLSGLFNEAKWKAWSPATFYPYLDAVMKAFGPDRVMFGSDWPVMLVSGMYVQWKSLLEKYFENFSADDCEKIFRLNAVRFYSL